jgi:hypothetical protein
VTGPGTAAGRTARPIARLALRTVRVVVDREKLPVFHVFAEMFERARQAAEQGRSVAPANGGAS